jgi:hypothetical protein
LKSLFSAKLGAPYWKGPVALVDGSTIEIVAVESADGSMPEYSIVTPPDNKICPEAVSGCKRRKFPSARHAVVSLEREVNQALYRSRT